MHKRYLLAALTALSMFAGPARLAAQESPGTSEIKKMKYGFFVHYVWAGAYGRLTKDKNGQSPATMDELAKAFDVDGFVRDLSAWQVEYIIFTAWHANINPLFPSKTMKKWGLESHTCKRDLLGDVIKACKAKGIKVLFYTHPRDGHDLRGQEQVVTGWGPSDGNPNPDWSKFDKQKWNDFTNELYGELVDRYGKDIVGLYLDEGSGAGDSYKVVDYPRLRQTIKSRNPGLVMIQNFYGTVYSCDIGDKEYCHWGEFANRDGSVWPTYKMPVGTCFATTWWAATPAGQNTVKFSAEDMFRYTVLQAGANTDGGGVQWATAPYAGGGWETGVDETMRKIGGYIKPIAASIKGVYASRAFPTPPGQTTKSVAWGVATDATDGSATYLHVLRPPAGKSLVIGKSADGTKFTGADLLPSGKPVRLQADASGYQVTLPDDATWDALDTVIRLRVDPADLKARQSQAKAKLQEAMSALSAAAAKHAGHSSLVEGKQAMADAKRLQSNKSATLPEYQEVIQSLVRVAGDLSQPALPEASKNLALNKSVTTSTTHPSTQAGVLTSGQRDGQNFWSSSDGQASVDHKEWVKVDLGQASKVGSVFLIPRAANGGEGVPRALAIRLSLDGTTWETVAEPADLPVPQGKPRGFEFPPKSARYIMVEGTSLRAMPSDGNQYRMQFSGIEVFAPSSR